MTAAKTKATKAPEAPPWAGITEGRIVHVSVVGVGHCQPAIVVRNWGEGTINAQVFRDGGNDNEGANAPGTPGAATRWATSLAFEAEASGDGSHWHWPERAE